MSSASAEVAADFRDALQDLKQNSRPEISNLTIIAKENTEHAQAISRELEEHIKTTQPMYKLPALYVLDSIVKNVGTPYTVYLSRNLYNTFMDAYLVMDPGNRRAMDGLLKTWKQPVPESMDTRPVFPAEVTRDIENTLIKIRTATVQQQAQAQRLPHGLPPRPATNPVANTQWRNTPTPPQNAPRYPPPNDPRLRHLPPNNHFAPAAMKPVTPPPALFPPPMSSTPVSSDDLETLRADLARLIAFTTTVSLANPSDGASQRKLKALHDLQKILNTQTVPPAHLQAIRAQIQALQPPAPMPAFPPPAPAPVASQPLAPPPLQTGTPVPPFNIAQLLANAGVVPPTPQLSTPVNANPTQSLAEMLRRITTPVQQTSTPTQSTPTYAPPPAFPPIPQPATAPPAAPAPVPPPTNNLAQLLAGLGKPPAMPGGTPQPPVVPPFPPPQPGAPVAAPPVDLLANLLKGLPSLPPVPMPPAATPAPPLMGAGPASGMVELTTAAMKQPRFHLVEALYGAKPNACSTCGRRFDNTQEGKQKKARHMDWHFKVKDPDAQKRGVHRSWYISEREWIDYREVDENSPFPQNGVGGMGAAGTGAAKIDAKEKYVRVPAEPSLHGPCPICQENFEQSWNKEANDFVWKDAVSIGGKIYHATCWEEYSRAGGPGVVAPGTPDSVLGKRKAELADSLNEKKVRAY